MLAILLTVMALPLVGLFFFRIYENQLVRQTEAELIGQGAAIAAIYAREVREAGLPTDKLGAAVATAPDRNASSDADDDDRYRPIEPSLDLAVDPTLDARPIRCRRPPIRSSRRSARGSPMCSPTRSRPRWPGCGCLIRPAW